MKANELRIGNYIELDGKVESIWEISLDYYDEGFPYISAGDNHIVEFRQCRHKPIPLTEEWLEKFGFIKYDQMGDWSFWNYKLPNERNWNIGMLSKGWHVSFGGLNWDNCPIIEYVHELQNLYFAITRNELILIK